MDELESHLNKRNYENMKPCIVLFIYSKTKREKNFMVTKHELISFLSFLKLSINTFFTTKFLVLL